MPHELKKTIILVGMMGAGKTAVGGAVARKLAVPFLDQDDEIEKAANCTVAELFRCFGEAFFREKETQVLARLLKQPPCILSTGGGAFMSPRNRALIEQNGVAVWLQAELDLLWARVRHRSTRPLLKTARPYDALRDLYHARNPTYALAPIHVAGLRNLSVDQMADAVIASLAEHPEILEATNHALR